MRYLFVILCAPCVWPMLFVATIKIIILWAAYAVNNCTKTISNKCTVHNTTVIIILLRVAFAANNGTIIINVMYYVLYFDIFFFHRLSLQCA